MVFQRVVHKRKHQPVHKLLFALKCSFPGSPTSAEFIVYKYACSKSTYISRFNFVHQRSSAAPSCEMPNKDASSNADKADTLRKITLHISDRTIFQTR